MKISRINQIGKRGKANRESRNKIAEICEAENLCYCEIQFTNICMRTFGLAPAHRHKRDYYNGDAEKLADKKQWVIACQACHNEIEVSKEKTEEVFLQLRGEE